jgi:imidazolonepropionase-like amidohydrolase
MMRKAKALGDSSLHSFQLAHEYGLTVALGTDYSNSPNTPFREIGKEFYSLTRCGYSPMEAIKAGTTNGALLMKKQDQFGRLEAGMLADIVLVDGNPLDDIKLLAHADHVKLVLIGGKVEKNIM